MTQKRETRPGLTRERVIKAAVELVDVEGLDALTMRRLGAALGVEAMSLYKHVANKDDLINGLVEFVIGQIEIDPESTDWKEAMRQRAITARRVLVEHSWAVGLMESRALEGSVATGYIEATLSALLSSGLSTEEAVHAFWLLDSYVYGHVVQESTTSRSGANSEGTGVSGDDYPRLAETEEAAQDLGMSIEDEFEFGLELILDALEQKFA